MCLDYKVSGSYCLSLKRVWGCVFILSAEQFRGLLTSSSCCLNKTKLGGESPLWTVLLKPPPLSFATQYSSHLLGNVPPASCALDCVSVWNRVRESTGSRIEGRDLHRKKRGFSFSWSHLTCHAGSQFPSKDWTHAPCIGSLESQPLGRVSSVA